jgi:hypothetical protein
MRSRSRSAFASFTAALLAVMLVAVEVPAEAAAPPAEH